MQKFFLTTFAISQKPIYTVHNNKSDHATPTLKRKINKDKISKEDKDRVRMHIEAFPTVESHYCRANSSRKYLSPRLNVSAMYNLYKDICTEDKVVPVKLELYRHIFNYEYNFDFLRPKKDLCDVCMEYRT